MFERRRNPKSTRVYAYCALITAVLLFMISQMVEQLGFKFNLSASMPQGLWKLSKFNGLPLKNNVIVFCPPPCFAVSLASKRGYFGVGPCPNGGVPLLKPVVAVAGDHVEITIAGIKVNDQLLPNSATSAVDGSGRFMPQIALGHYRVQKDQVWVISSFTPKSFDSRYFGPVSLAHISHRASSVWLKNS